MSLNLGLIKSNDKMIVNKIINNSTLESKVIDLVEFEQEPLDLLLVDEQINLSEIDLKIAGKDLYECNLFPIRQTSDFNLSHENFEKLETKDLISIYEKASETWSFQSNISLMKNIAEITKNITSHWSNDRTTFFEELWYLLKINLGASELTLIYNDLEKKKDKNELIRIKVSGKKFPNPQKASEVEDKLFKSYENEFSEILKTCEWDSLKKELTMTFSINKSPVLIMAKTPGLNKIQTSILQGFIGNINFTI